MTGSQVQTLIDLHRCTFLPGSYEKRFVRQMFNRAVNNPEPPITENQEAYLKKLYHSYRKQIGSLNHNLHCELCAEQDQL